ncbi:NADP-dependent oxidoreductase [Streptomyces sp. NPDC048479]|uniref:NADP-dependent oxidoreductase n=1 Tax=Streptomyces sp. NPDC048479 TaxID=3154725 RepID=UPI0034168417
MTTQNSQATQNSQTTHTSVTVQQTARPTGFPTRDHFAFVEAPVPTPGPGTALVENLYWSVDPYHREMMDGYFELNAPLEGRTLGRVVASHDPGLQAGDLVFHRLGWRTHAVVTLGTNGTRKIQQYAGVPLSAYLSILGGTGLTAYVALTRTLRLKPGEDLFVSAAAGGVGTAVGRIARLLGAGRIVGSAGSAAKVAYLTGHLGFDAAFDYHDGTVRELLAKAAPGGIDVYVDNVGGDHLEDAIATLRDHGRIAWVGAVGQYNTAEPPAAPRNLYDVVGKSLRLEGVLVRNYTDVQGEFEEFLVPHLRSGRISPDVTVLDGFGLIVDAFLGMLRGENRGKMLVRA